MHVTILTLGSRGDVQPYIAVGRGLLAAGHGVRLVTAAQFEGFVRGHGLDFAPLDRRFLELTDTSAGQSAFEGGNKLQLYKMVRPALRQILDDSWSATQGTDAIIYHLKILAGYHLAEKLGIPAMIGMPLPAYPTSAFANPVLPSGMPSMFNRPSYRVNQLGKMPFAGMINDWRRSVLGLPPTSRFAAEDRLPDGRPIPVLHAYSPHVVPTPPDWPPHVTTTGYWFLDQPTGWEPPKSLLEFLDDGPPPVYVGFGSMTTREPEAKARIIIAALERAGQRGLIAAGWGGLRTADLPPSFHVIKEAPHEWLFPHMAAVVHHGGAGTTAAGLYAGRPTVVVPFFGDQGFWGRRVHTLGAGPEPIPQKALTVERLAAAIHDAVTSVAMRTRAEALGAALRAEDGVGVAVRFIENWMHETNERRHHTAHPA